MGGKATSVVVWVLSTVGLITQLGFGIVTPALPAYAVSFGVGTAAVGLAMASYGLARLVTNYPSGLLAERMGRRVVLISGGVILSVGSALCGIAPSFTWLVIFRFFAGVGAAMVVTIAQVILADVSSVENRGRTMSIYQGFFLLGIGLGPIPGGYLADNYGLAAPFFGFAVLALAGALVSAVLVPETRGWRRKSRENMDQRVVDTTREFQQSQKRPTLITSSSPSAILSNRAFLLVGLVSFAQFFTRTGAVFSIVPLMGYEELGLSTSQVGAALSLTGMINISMLYPSGWIADRFGRKLPIVAGTFLSGIAIALYAMSGNYATFLIASALWGMGSGIAGPLPAAYAADLASQSAYGATMGMYRSVADVGYVLGPLFISAVAEAASFSVSLLGCTVLFLIGGVLFAWKAPETRRTIGDPGTGMAPSPVRARSGTRGL